MKALRIIAILLAGFAVAIIPVAAAKQPVWETVARWEPDRSDVNPSSTVNLDVRNDRGIIYITVDQDTDVEVFTILGQLVTRRHVPAGTVRLTLGQKGVYIVKAESATRRINI